MNRFNSLQNKKSFDGPLGRRRGEGGANSSLIASRNDSRFDDIQNHLSLRIDGGASPSDPNASPPAEEEEEEAMAAPSPRPDDPVEGADSETHEADSARDEPAAAGIKELSEDELHEEARRIRSELATSHNVEEALERVRELDLSSETSTNFLVSQVLSTVDAKPADMPFFAEWVVGLAVKGVVEATAFDAGLSLFLEELDDHVLDAPKLPDMLLDTLLPKWRESDKEAKVFSLQLEKEFTDKCIALREEEE